MTMVGKEITFKHGSESWGTIVKPNAKNTRYLEARDKGSYIEYASFSGYYRVDKKTLKVTLFDGVTEKEINDITVTIK